MTSSRTSAATQPVLPMVSRRVLDLVVAAIGIALGITVIALVPAQIPGQSFTALRDMSSSAFMPILASLLIITCSAVLLLRSLTMLRQPDNAPADWVDDAERGIAPAAEDGSRPSPDHAANSDVLFRLRQFCLAVLIFGAYLVLTATVGMLIATAITMFALSFAFGYRRKLPMFISVIATSIAIYILFEKLLVVILPRGGLF